MWTYPLRPGVLLWALYATMSSLMLPAAPRWEASVAFDNDDLFVAPADYQGTLDLLWNLLVSQKHGGVPVFSCKKISLPVSCFSSNCIIHVAMNGNLSQILPCTHCLFTYDWLNNQYWLIESLLRRWVRLFKFNLWAKQMFDPHVLTSQVNARQVEGFSWP